MSEENINDAWTKFNLYGSFEMEKTSTSASSAPAKGEYEYTNSSNKDGTSCSFHNGEITASIFERDQPPERAPDSSPLCISTKTKIAFLNTDNIDICREKSTNAPGMFQACADRFFPDMSRTFSDL